MPLLSGFLRSGLHSLFYREFRFYAFFIFAFIQVLNIIFLDAILMFCLLLYFETRLAYVFPSFFSRIASVVYRWYG